MIGLTLSHYKILDKLGAGGMQRAFDAPRCRAFRRARV